MVLVEDDSILHPKIDADSFLYISSLNEDHTIYTRFFDALLINRNQHRSFFRDLKAFRQQPHVVVILDQSRENRAKSKEITLTFLGSRFCHPWCRRTPLKKGFWRAEWGTIDGKQKDAETEQEEQRLHKLLVPLWVIMRSKMFPGEDIVKSWCIEERSRLKHDAIKARGTNISSQCKIVPENNLGRYGNGASEADLQSLSEEEATDKESQSAAHAATSVFRLAAAGVLLSQTPKRKLRWLVKKS